MRPEPPPEPAPVDPDFWPLFDGKLHELEGTNSVTVCEIDWATNEAWPRERDEYLVYGIEVSHEELLALLPAMPAEPLPAEPLSNKEWLTADLSRLLQERPRPRPSLRRTAKLLTERGEAAGRPVKFGTV